MHKNKLLPTLLSLGVIITLIVYPDKYLPISLDGIKIFAVNVLPALLPFFFFTKILSSLGAGNLLGKMLYKPCLKLYNTSGSGGYIYVMSVLSGYPVGAKLLADFTTGGYLSKDDAKTIMSYTSTSGPMFIVGSVGAVMLCNKTAGYVILLSHLVSALLNGLIYRNKRESTQNDSLIRIETADNVLSESVYSAVISVAIAGSYVAIFYTCAYMLKDFGVIDAISNFFNLFLNDVVLSDGLAFGLIEMTGGCLALSKSVSFLRIPLICAIVSFGGLSVTLQSLTFLEPCGIKPMRYLLCKLTQSIIAFLICYIIVRFIYPCG